MTHDRTPTGGAIRYTDVKCPTCSAPAGQTCHDDSGDWTPVHHARRVESIKAEAAR